MFYMFLLVELNGFIERHVGEYFDLHKTYIPIVFKYMYRCHTYVDILKKEYLFSSFIHFFEKYCKSRPNLFEQPLSIQMSLRRLLLARAP